LSGAIAGFLRAVDTAYEDDVVVQPPSLDVKNADHNDDDSCYMVSTSHRPWPFDRD
jgi:hypothetical protein